MAKELSEEQHGDAPIGCRRGVKPRPPPTVAKGRQREADVYHPAW